MTNTLLPDVSVVIPAFNAEAYLTRAIDSVLLQEGCRFEILIVNNNSTDETVVIAEGFKMRYPDQIQVLHESRPGASCARNCGLASAKAPWIQFLDADDVLLPNKLARQLKMISPEVNWIVGTIRLQAMNGDFTDAVPVKDYWFGLLTYSGMGHLDANLFRRPVLLELNGFDEDYVGCEDFDLFFRLVKGNHIPLIDEIPGATHIHHTGLRITNVHQLEMAALRIELSKRMNDHLKQHLKTYSQENCLLLNTSLLNSIRQQVAFAPKAAKKNYSELFPSGFERKRFRSDLLPKYHWLYLIFDVVFIEKIRVVSSRWIPEKWKKWLK